MILSLRELIFDNKDVFLCSSALFCHHSIKNLQNWFVVEKDFITLLSVIIAIIVFCSFVIENYKDTTIFANHQIYRELKFVKLTLNI